MLKTLLFDLDNTLLDFHWAEAHALKQALSQMGVTPTAQVVSRYSAINQSLWELLEQKKITRPELLVRRFELLYKELGVSVSSRETQAHYIRFLSQGHKFMPGAEAVLEALSPRYALYLVSNGTAVVQKGRLESADISHYFKGIFISETMGADKPQKAFFDQCFAAIPDFRREEAIIIGDSLTSDIRGGNNAGIKTCWYNPKGEKNNIGVQVDFEIGALSLLPELLDRINEAEYRAATAAFHTTQEGET